MRKEYYKDECDNEYWIEDGNEVRFKSREGIECWFEYDENNNMIHHKISDGREFFYKYKKIVEVRYEQEEISEYEFERMTEEKGDYASVESRLEILDL